MYIRGRKALQGAYILFFARLRSQLNLTRTRHRPNTTQNKNIPGKAAKAQLSHYQEGNINNL